MDHRLGRTVRVFLVALAAAGFYRLAIVPWIEPRVRDVQAELELSPEQAAAIRARADRRLAALGEVFPPGSWEREDPIMLESRQMRLLFKEYHTLPDGRVNIVPCTLVVLPDRNRVATEGPGRTFILRAPRGAVLEFDEPIDLKQGRLSKLVGGSLRGQVTIRGLPTASGAEDDIEIVTRDIELDELQVQTLEAVQFRYGRSTGSGRGLVVRLTPRQGPAGQGPNIGGVESVRLDRDVRMRLEGLAGGLAPGREPAAGEGQPGEPPPPVLVSCRGSLCLNVAADVITLEDKVDVVRTGTQSGTDHLACDLLAILLGRREQAAPTGAAAAAASPATSARGPLEPIEIQAKGSPVVATSAQAGLEARAARLGYEIATRRIVLDGDDPVALVIRTTDMEARKIDYCPGPAGSPGALVAVGPGRLATRPEQGQPARARWQQWLRMRPDGAGHVVSLAGDTEVAVEGQGRLAAAEMHLWLDVVAPGAGPTVASAGPDLSRIRPSRLLARGMVEADAEQVEARTDRLELWFRSVAAETPANPAPIPAAAPPATPGPAAAPPPRAAAAPARAVNRIAVSAGLVRGRVVMGPTGGQLDEMSLEGQVRLVDQAGAPVVPGAPAPEPGLEVLGDQMQVSQAAGPDARAIVSGRPARIRGRGLDLTGPMVEFDRGRGRITVDGAGRLALPMAGNAGGLDLMGFSSAAPAAPPAAGPADTLDVVWQGRMDFDGRTARFVDRVVTTSGAAAVTAGSLDVVFDRPFDLGGPPRPGTPQPQVVKVACGGGVHVESQSVAEDGGRSRDRLHARDLVVDRVTGDVSGTGPGRLTSTRLGQPPQLAPPAGPGGIAAQPVSTPRPAAGLTYLGVDFQRGLRGNIHQRRMEFHQRVEAIWGPVAGWDDALDPHAAAGLPAGVVTVSCDVLGIGQVPPAPGRPRPSMELAAGGNVLVEGESFTARSARLTWAEAKDLLVFEGDGRADAQLFRQLQAGAQPSSASAGKILYWRGLNRVDVEDVRYLDLDQLRGGAAPNLPGAAGGAPAPVPQRSLPGT